MIMLKLLKQKVKYLVLPNISGLATNSALTAVENKIPNIGGLIKNKQTNKQTNKKRQIITQKLLKLKKKLTDYNHDKYTNILLLQNLIIQQQEFLLQDQHKKIQ